MAAQQLAPPAFAPFEATLHLSLAAPLARPAGGRRLAATSAGYRAADQRLRAGGPASAPEPDAIALAFAGPLGGTAGLFAGAVVGDYFQSTPCEDCYLAAFAGAVLGESLGIPLAVHLADGRRGRPAPGMVASLAIAAGGLVIAGQLRRAEFLLVVPVLQIATVVASEQHTAGRPPS
jgi:hypothetical protein